MVLVLNAENTLETGYALITYPWSIAGRFPFEIAFAKD